MKFKSDIEVQAGLRDSSGSSGASGQILSSTASGVSWINQTSLSGYVPYTGATGNVDLGTHTLSSYNLIVNHSSGSGVAASITKGGNGEALTINKTSGSGNAMSVSGGLTSLVDLTLSSIANATIDTDKFIVSDSGAIKYRTGAQVLSDIGGQAALTNPITGTGTTNYVSKFTGTTTLGDSLIYDNGTNVGINNNTPNYALDVIGSASISSNIYTNNVFGLSFGTVGYANSNTLINTYTGKDILFAVNSSEKMRVTSTGNVGIGTTTPTAIGTNITTLDIKGSSGGGIRSGVTGGSESTFYTIAAGSYLGTISNIPLNFQTNNSVKATILANGNVGIGNTGPGYKLDVSGTGRFSSDLLTTGRFGVGSTNINSRVFASAFSGELATAIFTTFDSAQSGQEAARFSTSDLLTGAVKIYPRVGAFNYNVITVADSAAIINQPTKPLLVGVQDGSAIQFTETDIIIGTNNSEKVRITSGGNVGIGTTPPSEKLDVYGVIRGVYTADPGAGAVTGKFLAYSPSAYGLVFRGYNTGAHSIQVQREANDAEIYPLSLQPNGGNVGIGTISPHASAILHLDSTEQGFLPPRMKKADRDDIGSPMPGLMIFDKDEEVLQVYTSDGWRTIAWT